MTGAPDSDRRQTPRQRMLKTGRIVVNAASSTINCTVRNLTEKGAKLQVASIIGIPAAFDLIVAPGTTRQPCKVIWRTPTELGVEFVAAG